MHSIDTVFGAALGSHGGQLYDSEGVLVGTDFDNEGISVDNWLGSGTILMLLEDEVKLRADVVDTGPEVEVEDDGSSLCGSSGPGGAIGIDVVVDDEVVVGSFPTGGLACGIVVSDRVKLSADAAPGRRDDDVEVEEEPPTGFGGPWLIVAVAVVVSQPTSMTVLSLVSLCGMHLLEVAEVTEVTEVLEVVVSAPAAMPKDMIATAVTARPRKRILASLARQCVGCYAYSVVSGGYRCR